MSPRAGTTLRLSTCDCAQVGLAQGKVYEVDTADAFRMLYNLRLTAHQMDEMVREGKLELGVAAYRYFSVHVPDSLGGWLHVVDAVDNTKKPRKP